MRADIFDRLEVRPDARAAPLEVIHPLRAITRDDVLAEQFRALDGDEVKKIIYVPNRIINVIH